MFSVFSRAKSVAIAVLLSIGLLAPFTLVGGCLGFLQTASKTLIIFVLKITS